MYLHLCYVITVTLRCAELLVETFVAFSAPNCSNVKDGCTEFKLGSLFCLHFWKMSLNNIPLVFSGKHRKIRSVIFTFILVITAASSGKYTGPTGTTPNPSPSDRRIMWRMTWEDDNYGEITIVE